MSRAELFAEAKRLGLETTAQMKNADLVAAIEQAFVSASESADDKSDQPVTEASREPSAEKESTAEPSTEPETAGATEPQAEDIPQQPSAEAGPSAPEQEAEAKAPDEVQATEGEGIVKSGFLKVKIRDFRGSFLDAKFDDDGVCDRISEQTLRTLASEFPGIDVIAYEEL